MEKFVSFIILLVAAALLAPGCMAESTTVESANVMSVDGPSQTSGVLTAVNGTGSVGFGVLVADESTLTGDANVINDIGTQEPEVLDVTNATENNEEIAVTNATPVEGLNTTEVAPVSMANATMTADMSITNLTAKLDDTILISLKENPTTGYSWNVTNSSGLEIVSDEYVMDTAAEGMVGVGGVHDWMVKAVETGNQTFSAVYKHSWEPAT
ncbi:MAG: protease inhibitor I42 family protein, partial [Methanobacteriota archaeon]